MDKKEMTSQLKLRDRVTNLLDKDKFFRVAAIKNSLAARTAQQKHCLPLIPAFFLARQLAAATMVSSFLKGEERIILETESDGLISRVFAEAMQTGECRGFTEYDEAVNTKNFNDISDPLGIGFFKIAKILYDKSEPVTGIVDLPKGDIATDLAHYFNQSEQVPTAVVLDVDFDDEGNILESGGLLVQALPGAPEERIREIYNALSELKSYTEFLRKEYTPDKIITEILPYEFEITKSKQVDFFCRCSKESFMKKLITFGVAELEDMQKAGNNELVCQYCNEHYTIEESDFKEMIDSLKIKNN